VAWLTRSVHKVEQARLDTLVRTECALLQFDHEHTVVLARTAGNKAVNLCLVENANSILVDRLVSALNKSVEAL
jgi:hypothetical protein